MPPGLLQRQSARELERAVMELRRSGFSEAEIRARENMLRQNSTASTATALKEHFILERIAEEEKIDVEEGDYEKEIFLIAAQSGESPRRVRAQLEKRGLMDVLRNQIIERKVLEAGADRKPSSRTNRTQPRKSDTEAISMAAGGGSGGRNPRNHGSRKKPKRSKRRMHVQALWSTIRAASIVAVRRLPGRSCSASACPDATWLQRLPSRWTRAPLDVCRSHTKDSAMSNTRY